MRPSTSEAFYWAQAIVLASPLAFMVACKFFGWFE